MPLAQTYFVSRHPGALDWAQQAGIAVDHHVEHLDPTQLNPGDRVIGTLPVHLAAAVCAHGAEYWHLSIDLPPQSRGHELSADDLKRFNARVERFHVARIPWTTNPVKP